MRGGFLPQATRFTQKLDSAPQASVALSAFAGIVVWGRPWSPHDGVFWWLLVTVAFVAVVATVWFLYDPVFLWALVVALGLSRFTRGWEAWVLTVAVLAVGLALSRLVDSGCSVWWRGSLVYGKLRGELSSLDWEGIPRLVFGPGCQVNDPNPWFYGPTLLEEKTQGEQKLQLFQTALGTFWVPAPGKETIKGVVWENTTQDNYESGGVRLNSGDTIIDCGAHVGVFTRYALQHGAARVVALEPDPLNIVCLESNLAKEIADGRVIVMKGGVWNQETCLPLFVRQQNSLGPSFVIKPRGASELVGTPVFSLDGIVDQLKLARVDFIKMDVEGAEREALAGAGTTMAKFKPRMAISAYHLLDDPVAIPAVALKAQPAYRVHAKDIEIRNGRVMPKVLFFD